MQRCYNCMKEYPDGFDICPHCGSDRTQVSQNLYYLKPGVVLGQGRYQIGMDINAGGFGIVYKAWDTVLDKMIAIKEYYPGGIAARTPGTSQVLVYSEKRIDEYEKGKVRFLSEARKLAQFNTHPNIVDVYDFFEENNTAYMVMEYMDGMTYKAYIKEQGGHVSQQVAVGVTLALLDALKEVHKEKIIHRDINPNNIFICTNGVVKLFDFGAARIEESEMSSILTPHYAPPEQYSTESVQKPYTDLYAVGATMYFALTGVKPEESTDRVQEDHLIPPHELNPEISEELSNAVMRAMALKVELRYQNTDQFRDALLNKKPVLNVEQELRRRRRVRIMQAVAVMAVLAVSGGACMYQYQKRADAARLGSAQLEVWIPVKEYDTPESAEQMFQDMTEAFREEYAQVQLSVMAIPQEEYQKRLEKAAATGTLPDLFESGSLSEEYELYFEPLDTTLNLLEDPSQFYFLEQYERLFPEKKQMPLCFQMPVIYADGRSAPEMSWNTEDYSVRSDDFLVYDRMMGEECIQDFEKTANQAGRDFLRDGYEMFQEGEVQFYLSDTGDYRLISEHMAGEYQVMLPQDGQMEARLDHLWSVSASAGKEEKKAAQWLLRYLLSDNAQNILSVRNMEGIPLSKTMCEVYFSVYQGELSGLKAHISEDYISGGGKNGEYLAYMKQWEDQ